MQLQWDETYATGHAEIDDQHQQIFAYLNDLEHQIQQPFSKKWAEEFIATLIHYIRNHFYFEEMVMRKKECSVASKNKAQHIKLLAALTRTQQQLKQGGYDVESLARLQTFLAHWFMYHTLHIDIKLRDCI
jgi:hemerythrin-like metal-binding protein